MVESDPSLLLRNVGLLVTLNSDLGTIRDAAVCIENNRICWVGRDAELPEKYAAVGNVKSLPDRIVIPGLVNTHHHMFQCLTRCVAQVARGVLADLEPGFVKSIGQTYQPVIFPLDMTGVLAFWVADHLVPCMGISDGKTCHVFCIFCSWATKLKLQRIYPILLECPSERLHESFSNPADLLWGESA